LGLALAAPIEEVEVVGADPVLAALARIALPFGVGDEPADLAVARTKVMESGYFKEAKLRLEGNKLIVEVVPNPSIAKVSVQARAFPEAAIVRFLENEQAVGVGAIYNAVKAADAGNALATVYARQGFPFTPKVTAETQTTAAGVELKYVVEENPAVQKVEVGTLSYVPRERVEPMFLGVPVEGKFDLERYRQAVSQTANIYAAAGFRGSGANLQKSRLEGGILKVEFSELRVEDVVAVGVETGNFALKGGDPFNLDKLLNEVNALGTRLNRVINYDLEPTSSDTVRIRLSLGEERFGAIREVNVEGVTALPAERVQKALKLQVNNAYSPRLAEEDFRALFQLYEEAGYRIVGEPRINFNNGVYTQRVREVRIKGYRFEWAGEHRTQEEVLLRELPKPGSLFSVQALRVGLTRMYGLSLLAAPPTVNVEPVQSSPEEIIVVFGDTKENRTGTFSPAIGWSSIEGWSGTISYRESNLWGLNHQPAVEVSLGLTNDAGENFSFSASYSIPWLFVDFLDFKDVRTALSFGIYSTPIGNNIFDPAKFASDKKPYVESGTTRSNWEYTERKNGLFFGISRPLFQELPNLRLGFNFRYEFVTPKLELGDAQVYDTSAPPATDPNTGAPIKGPGPVIGGPNDPNRYKCNPGNTVALGCATLSDILNSKDLKPYQTLRFELTGTYANVDNDRFPTDGFFVRGDTALGLRFAQDGSSDQFVPVSVTGGTYFRLDAAARQALALRVSAGQLFRLNGDPPASQKFSLGGDVDDFSILRGYDARYFNNGETLLSGSLEYRYDLTPGEIGTNLFAFVFADIGGLWGRDYSTLPAGLYAGIGFGLNVRLDLLGAILPPIRLEYGFSEKNPSGKFSIRFAPQF
jgi:outer membrane protein insertion porin family